MEQERNREREIEIESLEEQIAELRDKQLNFELQIQTEISMSKDLQTDKQSYIA